MSKSPAFPRDPERQTFHVVITPYGSRLQGSERGSHRHGTGPVMPSKGLEEYQQDIMTGGRIVFSSPFIREIVHNSILKTCAEK